jgi:hypothetical protein
MSGHHGGRGRRRRQRPRPPAPHHAYADDASLTLGPKFDDKAVGQVRRLQQLTAAGGLDMSWEKCVVVAHAPGGKWCKFEEWEIANMRSVSLTKYVDASTPEHERGVKSLGVPVGENAWVRAFMHDKLLGPKSPLWQLGWQLIGMARTDFPAALRIFRGSLTKRFGYLARNVDPKLAAPWLGGYDGLCAWVLERMLQIKGACSPADMRTHLLQACTARDTERAASGWPSALAALGPEGIVTADEPPLPLRVARLPQRDGGLGLPSTHVINRGAFVAMGVATLAPAMLRLLPHLHLAQAADKDGAGAAGDSGDARAGDDRDSDGDPGPDQRPAGPRARQRLLAAVPLPPMVATFRTHVRHFHAVAQQEDARSERQAHGLGTQRDGDGDVCMGGNDSLGAAQLTPASQQTARTQYDSDGDVKMGLADFATASSSSDDDDMAYDSAGDPVRRPGRRAPPPSGDFEPPVALARSIPTPLLEWALGGATDLDAFICACVRTVASSPQDPNTEELLRAAGKMGYLERVVDLPVVDYDAPGAARRGRSGNRGGGGRREDDDDPPKVQKVLTGLVMARQLRTLEIDLQRSGACGQVALAQLHSQRGPGALAWLSCPARSMSSLAMVQMVLVALCAWSFWQLDGDSCPFCGTTALGGPTALHAFSCSRQNIRGATHTHTAVVNGVIRALRRHHARWLSTEDPTPFIVADRRMDVVVAPQTLALACEEEFALKGVLLDATVHCPTAPTYYKRAAREAGWLCKMAEKEKFVHYRGTFDVDRYVLAPFAMESFGRMGKRAVNFVRMLASHSAAMLGGSEGVVKRRIGVFRRQIMMELSLSLARELAERLLTYVRGAATLGRTVRPASTLLALSPALVRS